MKIQLEKADYLGKVMCHVARNTILIPSELTEVLVGKKGVCIHLTPEFSRHQEND